MSVIATYAHLSSAALDECRANPDWLDALDSNAIVDSEVMDIDKACDGLVWLLSRVPLPPSSGVQGAAFVLRRSLAPLLRGEGGTKEPRLVAPYDPALSLSVDQVSEISNWLRTITPEQLRPLYNPRAMDAEAIYPQIWTREGSAALDDYLLPRFQVLKQFFERAAQAKHQVIVFFT